MRRSSECVTGIRLWRAFARVRGGLRLFCVELPPGPGFVTRACAHLACCIVRGKTGKTPRTGTRLPAECEA